jgi:hypothetical protein
MAVVPVMIVVPVIPVMIVAVMVVVTTHRVHVDVSYRSGDASGNVGSSVSCIIGGSEHANGHAGDG